MLIGFPLASAKAAASLSEVHKHTQITQSGWTLTVTKKTNKSCVKNTVTDITQKELKERAKNMITKMDNCILVLGISSLLV